jgi:hypothetical protein
MGTPMEVNPLFLMEFVVFSGGVLAWALWEYFSVGRELKKKPSSDDARHPEG